MASPASRASGSRRVSRSALAMALAAALFSGGAALTVTAAPATAEPPGDPGRPVATAAAGDRNPNADDDAYKDVPCELLPEDNSDKGSPSEQDQNDGCATPETVVAVQQATIAEPVDLLPCGDSISTDGKGSQPDVDISRLTDADKTSDDQCDPFPYDLKAVDGGLRFLKPNGYPFAQFFVDVEWRSDNGDTEDFTYVDFELIEGGYEQPALPCPASLRDPLTDEVVGLTPDMDLSPAGLVAAGIIDQDGMPGAEGAPDNGLTQFACVIERTSKYVPDTTGEGHFRVFERLYLLGDIFIRR